MKDLPVRLRRASRAAGTLVTLALLATCVDAPAAPEGPESPGAFVIAPAFSLVGPEGPAMSEGQENALSDAFDLVDRFRMQVRRATGNVMVLDTVLLVTPGGDEYDLSVPIAAASSDEQFLVTLTALQGTTELFKAENIPTRATAANVAGAPPPPALQIPLVYSGPGATAASVTVGPTQVVLAPGAGATLGAAVRDAAGAVVAGVPIAWTTSAATVATVTRAGQVAAAGDGLATLTATTPTGLFATAILYVVAGDLAYVEGGALNVRGVAGGTPVQRATGGASQPAWSGDGQSLAYVSGGTVHRAGGPPLLAGTWPSFSPDGTKLAVERGGQVFFANDDGTLATAGPSGAAPVWSDGATVVVGGGSIERVRADGTARETLVPGDATLPSLANDGRIASISGGALRVSDVPTVLVTGATGRATWSPNGRWLVVATGGGLVLVPSDGSAAPVALPGLGGGTDPAFRRTGTLVPPSGVTVAGFRPDPPIPGSPVEILGSGFDWIIGGNNRVIWPTRDGSVAGEIQAVTEGSLATVMPRNVIGGQVRVETRASSALLAFVPTVGTLDVTSRTPWGAAVSGVGLALAGTDGTTARTTGDDGLSSFPGLIPGTYTLTITPPEGYQLTGQLQRTLAIPAEVVDLALELTPDVGSVTLSPDPRAVSVGGTLPVTLQVTDASGQPVPQVEGLVWRSASAELTVSQGPGLTATLGALFAGDGPGSSVLEVVVAGRTYEFPVSVTSRIQGTVRSDTGATPAPPAADAVVEVKRGGVVVAQATSGADGRYSVEGLYRGTYDVAPTASADRLPVPAGQTVILDQASPTGTADFLMRSFASLDVTARTPASGPVRGVVVTLTDPSGNVVARDTTGTDGTISFTRLAAGSYTATITVAPGFSLTGPATRALALVAGPQALDLEVTPLIQAVTVIPESLTVEVGSTLDVEVMAFDAQGNLITQVQSAGWFSGSDGLVAGGTDFRGQVAGTWASPPGAPFLLQVELNGRVYSFPVTVTSFIEGTIAKDPDPIPAPGVGGVSAEGIVPPLVAAQGVVVTLAVGGTQVAQTVTNGAGQYRLAGLAQGVYDVAALPVADLSPVPTSQSVTLDDLHATGTADFLMSRAPVDSIAVSVAPDTITALGGTATVTVLAFDTAGAPLLGRTPTYVSANPAVVQVNGGGLVTAVDNGSTWIRVTLGSKVDSVRVTVDQRAATVILSDSLHASLADTALGFVAETEALLYEARDANGNLIPPAHRVPTFASSNGAVATIDTGGNVTLVAVGIADLSVTMDSAIDVLVVRVLGSQIGDLVIDDAGDLAYVQANSVGRVTGDLYVVDTGLPNLNGLETILDVQGSVLISGNASLVDVSGLRNLEQIGADLTVLDNDALVTPGGFVAALEVVFGDVRIEGNTSITNLDVFGNLQEIFGGLKIQDNASLQEADGFASLDFVGYDVELISNPSLSSLGNFPALDALSGSLILDAGAAVFGMPILERIGGALLVGGYITPGNTVLQQLAFPELTCSDGVTIYGNYALTTVNLPKLERTDNTCAYAPVAPMRASAVRGVRALGRVPAGLAPRVSAAQRLDRVRSEGRARFVDAQEARAERQAARAARRADNEGRRPERRESTVVRDMAFDLPGTPVTPSYQAYLDRRGRQSADGGARDAKAPKPARPTIPSREYSYDGGVEFYDNIVLTNVSLPALTTVESGVYFQSNPVLQSVSLPALETVGNDLNFNDNEVMTSLSAPQLTSAGSVYLYSNDLLASVFLPALATLDYDLDVYYHPVLSVLSLPSLASVGDEIDIGDNQGLTRLEIPVLSYVGDEIYLYDHESLSVVEIATAAALTVDYGVYIDYNTALTSLLIPGLTYTYDDFELYDNVINGSVVVGSSGPLTIGYDLELDYNAGSFTFSMPGLVHVGDDIDVYDNPGLTSFTAATTGGPATIGYEVYFWDNAGLTSVSLPNVTFVDDDVEFGDNPALQSVSMASLTAIDYSLWLQDNGSAGAPLTFSFPALQTVRYDIYLRGTVPGSGGVVTFNLPALTTAEEVYVEDNPRLTSLSFPALTQTDYLEIRDNPDLVSLTLPALVEARSGLDVVSNTMLQTFSAPALVRTMSTVPAPTVTPSPLGGGGIYVYGNPALTGFDLSALNGTSHVEIESNFGLVNLPSMPALHPGASVFLHDNTALANLNGLAGVTRIFTLQVMNSPSLSDVAGLASLQGASTLDFQDNDALPALSLPALVQVWNSLNVVGNDGLVSVSAPSLATLGAGTGTHATVGTLALSSNPLQTDADFPALTTLNSRIFIQSTALTDLDGFSALTSPVYGVSVTSNATLADVGGLEGIGTTFSNPAVAGFFQFTGNPDLCSDAVDTLVAVIEARNPGFAFATVPLNSGNDFCG
jgi:hypothetical protein